MELVVARDDQQFVRRAAPERADTHHLVVGEQHSLALAELGFERGAQDATAFETAERALFFEQLARHEGQPEELTVGVGDGCAGLAAVVDDGLCVANVGGGGVFDEAALEHHHHLGRVGVAERMDAGIVITSDHEHLVRAAGFGLDVNRAAVVNGERLVAIERWIQVGDDADPPRAVGVDSVERRQRAFFATRAERARPIRVGFDLGDARREVGRTLSTLGHDRDPPPGEWIETQLTHYSVQLRTSCASSGRTEL